ncbi:hypothetical protein ACRALDRAFT_208498 [Sodiomyces alcalophilus JCM 7366]|uniref:uncharacterized protein n=1 Tax=Sodiomyces alcalophilus JCM 7366 TaxID=591952 RepID=UPI0039B6E966
MVVLPAGIKTPPTRRSLQLKLIPYPMLIIERVKETAEIPAEMRRPASALLAVDVIHCHVAPRNFILNATLDLHIADFAGSSVARSSPTVGPGPRYEPPNWSWHRPGNKSDDIFALGSVMYFIMRNYLGKQFFLASPSWSAGYDFGLLEWDLAYGRTIDAAASITLALPASLQLPSLHLCEPFDEASTLNHGIRKAGEFVFHSDCFRRSAKAARWNHVEGFLFRQCIEPSRVSSPMIREMAATGSKTLGSSLDQRPTQVYCHTVLIHRGPCRGASIQPIPSNPGRYATYTMPNRYRVSPLLGAW